MVLSCLKRLVVSYVNERRASIVQWTKPLSASLPLGTLADLGRSKPELIAENAFLRQQLSMLKRVLNEYVKYYNRARPHQGIQQQIPESYETSRSARYEGTEVIAVPILAGLHHDYQLVA